MRRPPLRPAYQVAHAIDDRLTEVSLETANRPMLKAFDAPQRSQECILDDVLGVPVAACVSGQSPMRPAADRRQRALDENLCGPFVTALGPFEDVQGGLGQLSLIGVRLVSTVCHDRRGNSGDNEALPTVERRGHL